MKKIPTLFEREFENHRIVRILPNVSPDLAWVMAGEGVATIKWDGACCAVINGVFYKDTMQNMENRFHLTLSSARRKRTLSPATYLVGCRAIEPHPATNGFGMLMTRWGSYQMEHTKPSARISDLIPTTLIPIFSSPTGKTLSNWIGASMASALIWKPM